VGDRITELEAQLDRTSKELDQALGSVKVLSGELARVKSDADTLRSMVKRDAEELLAAEARAERLQRETDEAIDFLDGNDELPVPPVAELHRKLSEAVASMRNVKKVCDHEWSLPDPITRAVQCIRCRLVMQETEALAAKPAESELLPCGQLRKLLRTVVTTLAVRQDKDGREDGLLKMLRDKLAAAKPAEMKGEKP